MAPRVRVSTLLILWSSDTSVPILHSLYPQDPLKLDFDFDFRPRSRATCVSLKDGILHLSRSAVRLV